MAEFSNLQYARAEFFTQEADEFLVRMGTHAATAKTEAERAAIELSVDQILNNQTADNAIPVNVLKARRLRTNLLPNSGSVWFGQLPINAAFLGPLRQSGTGSYAGDRFFDQAFIVHRQGYDALFRRRNKKRTPIDPVSVRIGTNKRFGYKRRTIDGEIKHDDYQDRPINGQLIGNLAVDEYLAVFAKSLDNNL